MKLKLLKVQNINKWTHILWILMDTYRQHSSILKMTFWLYDQMTKSRWKCGIGLKIYKPGCHWRYSRHLSRGHSWRSRWQLVAEGFACSPNKGYRALSRDIHIIIITLLLRNFQFSLILPILHSTTIRLRDISLYKGH